MRRALIAGCMLAALLPTTARAAPQIAFLNPSAYTTTLQVSDKSDTDTAVHLVAWVQEVPSTPIVEFEIQAPAQNAITLDGTRVGSSDTWEAFFSVPQNFPDDVPSTFRARVFSGFDEVASTEKLVTVNAQDIPPPPELETAELTYPENGGGLGFFTPKDGPPRAVLQAVTSSGALQVRGFYTLSDPGNDPEWKSCGSGRVVQGSASVRCTLAEGDAASEVGAVAMVANTTPPPAPPQPQADQTGDAHRVFPYAQQPTIIDIDPESVQQNPNTCQILTATVFDQNNQTIQGANFDIHAVGPTDQLRFGQVDQTTTAFKAPETGAGTAHPSKENGFDCDDEGAMATPGEQGDHNRPGQPDQKHIESTTGTNDDGTFRFALRSPDGGGTQIEGWGDVDDDDVLDGSEAVGGARIGWGEPPPPPQRTLNLDPQSSSAQSGSCEALTLIARQGGNLLGDANVDLHITGPDSDVTFCDPPEASLDRPPDQGGHSGDAHTEDGTRHAEGETSSNGRFVIGVTSETEGTTELLAWLDSTDDDLLASGEANVSGSISWQAGGNRRITIKKSDGRVEAGKKVTISGEINGDQGCIADQRVKLKARPADSSKRFKNIDTTRTDDEGDYKFKPVVNQSRDYRTVAPKDGVCRKAKSKTVTVRAT